MNLHTHTIALHIGNTEDLYRETMQLLTTTTNRYDFAYELRELVENSLFSATNDLFALDVLTSSLAEVNWAEIADDYWNEYHNIDAE
jgi:TnpA family transposase